MTNYCSECGGELAYDPVIKQYACKSCGLTFTSQQLMEARDRMLDSREASFEQKKRKQKEYLNWWLSKKD